MFSEPSKLRTVEVRAVRLGYREGGSPTGAPVVLLHGSGSEAATWDRFARELTAAGCRWIAVDLRGHATSTRTPDYALTSIRDDVLDLLDALGLRQVTLIGHSVGGYAAVAAALHSPEKIARLVLEDLAAPPQFAVSASLGGLLSAVAAAARILTQRRNYDLRAVASIIYQLSRPDPRWWEELAEVRTPTLILSGGPSSCIPPQRLAQAAATIPDARLATIPVGHRVHSHAPDRFAAEVLTFLAETDAAVGHGFDRSR